VIEEVQAVPEEVTSINDQMENQEPQILLKVEEFMSTERTNDI
jgi:hypothetical protein